MGVSSDIYGLIQQPQQRNPLADAAQVMQLQHAMGANALNQYTLRKAQREDEDANALSELYRGAVQPDGTVDNAKLLQGAAQRGLGARIPTIQKQIADADKARADVDKVKAETGKFNYEVAAKQAEHAASVLATARDQGSYDMARQTLASAYGPQYVSKMPPQFDQQWVQTEAARGMTYAQRMADLRAREQQAETNRHNTAAEGNQRAQLAQAERHFQTQQNAPQYMETNAGLVALPKRLAPGQQPQGVVVTGPDGQNLGKPLKDIPPAQNAAIIENTKALQNIDQAMAEITRATGITLGPDGRPTRVQGAKPTAPDALGAWNYLGDGIRQRTDPHGVPVRAQVANIAGQKFHDISGAAVSVGEAQRLRPFIPSDTDSPETALAKLANLRREYAGVNDMLGQTYSEGNGYKPSPVKARGGVVDLSSMPGGNGGARVVDFGSLK